jgi:protein SCO1
LNRTLLAVLHPRVRLAVTVVIACCAAAILAVVVASGSSGGGPKVIVPHGFAGALRPPQIPPKDFSLRDQDGDLTSLHQYRGQPVILTFMYSTCQNTCPIMADQIRGAMDDLGHDVPALAISVDPRNDTPLNAKRFLLNHALVGRMRFLLGTRAQLRPIWKAYGIQPQGSRFDHSAYVLLIDKRGKQRVGFPMSELTPEGLAHDVKVLQSEQIRSLQ